MFLASKLPRKTANFDWIVYVIPTDKFGWLEGGTFLSFFKIWFHQYNLNTIFIQMSGVLTFILKKNRIVITLVDTIYDSKRNFWILPAHGGLLVGEGG